MGEREERGNGEIFLPFLPFLPYSLLLILIVKILPGSSALL
jgi:hypothetical protein